MTLLLYLEPNGRQTVKRVAKYRIDQHHDEEGDDNELLHTLIPCPTTETKKEVDTTIDRKPVNNDTSKLTQRKEKASKTK